uniref:Uncharacterized protein n=1 Tax=Gossypium raimondii TaxID=29730 RepID=A0A0D2U6C5_GOSRA|nr:hypothetical protein B456_010G000300 [Gossypium raimondii]
MSLIQFRLTLSFSTSSMADLPSFSTEEFYWLASFFWGHHHLQTNNWFGSAEWIWFNRNITLRCWSTTLL